MKMLFKISCTILVCASLNAYAKQPAAPKIAAVTQLQKLLQPITSIKANFTQTVYSKMHVLIQTSTGNMEFKKPAAFRWQIDEPDASLIITDGQKMWNYDAALEQVTVQAFKTSTEVTPISFLFDDLDSIKKTFTVAKQNKSCFKLTPTQEDASFVDMQICFNKGKLQSLQLVDHLEQTSTFEFTQVQNNPQIAEDRFSFTPPKGVDVIDQLKG